MILLFLMTLTNQLHTARPHGNTNGIDQNIPGEMKMSVLSPSTVSVSVLGILCLLSLLDQGNSAVISIDFSSEWIKVALVKVGKAIAWPPFFSE